MSSFTTTTPAGKFLPIGTATVTDDGAYVRTDPDSGVKVAAWGDVLPETAEEKCEVKGEVDPDRKCTCTYAGQSKPCAGKFSFGTVLLGSGGGRGTPDATNVSATAGDGGGVILLNVGGTLTVDGTIASDGEPAFAEANDDAGGGSGGSVHITCARLDGTGAIRANGGVSGANGGGGGGGGRVRVEQDSFDGTFDMTTITAYGGNSGDAARNGGPGTVTTRMATDLPKLRMDNGGVPSVEGPLALSIGRPKNTSVQSNRVNLSGSPLWFNDLLIGRHLASDQFPLSLWAIVDSSTTTAFIDPDAEAGPLTTFDPHYYGVLVTDSHVFVADGVTVVIADQLRAPKVTVEAGGTLVHPASTTSYDEPSLDILATDTITVVTGATVDVSGRGYLGGRAPGNNNAVAYTIGNTTTGGAYQEGGSHGGQGGGSSPPSTYGSSLGPMDIGGGGGADASVDTAGGSGGGHVRFRAGIAILVDGVVQADGQDASGPASLAGGGAGGGIWFDSPLLLGSGTLTANGGAGADPTTGGGGGRIEATGFDGTTSVVGGPGAENGTVE